MARMIPFWIEGAKFIDQESIELSIGDLDLQDGDRVLFTAVPNAKVYTYNGTTEAFDDLDPTPTYWKAVRVGNPMRNDCQYFIYDGSNWVEFFVEDPSGPQEA